MPFEVVFAGSLSHQGSPIRLIFKSKERKIHYANTYSKKNWGSYVNLRYLGGDNGARREMLV